MSRGADPSARVALVTGAASGIGAAVCVRLAEAGWAVAGLDRNAAATDVALEVDVADPAAVDAGVEAAEARLGRISLLVAAAGVYAPTPVAALTIEQWRQTLRVNFGGTVNVCRAVVPAMKAAGQGMIVTISSELALAGGTGELDYVTAKGAVIGFTRSLAAELAPYGVRVNSVAPGRTDTPMLPPDSRWRDSSYLAGFPLGRLVTPDEVAATVVFLVDDGTSYVGQVLSPNGGAVL